MKAPEWVIDMMKTGEPVKCMTEDGERVITGFDVSKNASRPFYCLDHAFWLKCATPIKPPVVRPFRTVEEVEPFFGKIVSNGKSKAMINGARITSSDRLVVCIGDLPILVEEAFECYTFQDGIPVGITE